MKSRDISIDIAKGIAIILVELSHIGMGNYSFIIDGFFIPIFFILSGYTYNNSVSPNNYMVLVKFKRLLKPYFFFNLTFLCFYFLTHSFKFEGINLFIGIIYSRYCLFPLGANNNVFFLSMEGNAPTWFLTAMFVAYIFFFLLIRTYNKDKNLSYILILIYFVISILFKFLPILLPWSIDSSLFFSLFIFSGFIIRKYDILNKILNGQHKNLLFILFLGSYFGISFFNNHVNLSVRLFDNIFLLFITGILGTLFTIIISNTLKQTLLGKIFESIGIHSITIMSMHLFFFSIIKRTLYFAGITSSIVTILSILIASTTICFLISVIINKYFPKLIN